jgi:hypothetical protein
MTDELLRVQLGGTRNADDIASSNKSLADCFPAPAAMLAGSAAIVALRNPEQSGRNDATARYVSRNDLCVAFGCTSKRKRQSWR